MNFMVEMVALDRMQGMPLARAKRVWSKAAKQHQNRLHWAARKKALAEMYAFMLADLGGYCGAACDNELGCGSRVDLQLHHTEGSEWVHSKVGPLRRCYLYGLDWLVGRLGVLCRSCNEHDGGVNTWKYKAKREAAPF